MSEGRGNDFRERARVEADRYGPDPWIFVRELLQNARDAHSDDLNSVKHAAPSVTAKAVVGTPMNAPDAHRWHILQWHRLKVSPVVTVNFTAPHMHCPARSMVAPYSAATFAAALM